MEKINVYLQYPWTFADSPYYKYLVNNPPENVVYINAEKQKGVITKKRRFKFSNFVKYRIRDIVRFLRLPIPSLFKSMPKQEYDLVHCAHCMTLNKKPWIADFESAWQFWVSAWGGATRPGRWIIRKIIFSKNCKKIIPWTEATKKDILEFFPEIKDKVELIYPAVPFYDFKKIKTKEITLLFCARYFYAKGGLHALEAMDRLTKKYENVNCIVISPIPKKILEKYSSNKKIKFFELMEQKKLFKEIYPVSDIFVYPAYSDSIGFAILESMGFGIPTIAVDGFARKEIIDNKKTGFVIKRPEDYIDFEKIGEIEEKIVKSLVEKTSLLIKNPKLRKEMSQNCINTIKEGKFSIKQRNEKFEKIYMEALR